MDEHTLNDLLECSVCLERLDTSSKVLPCQHTFCRKCLEVIVCSRNELRCPECRVLVDIKINDLPPNVLLMRILEGMKHAVFTNKSEQIENKIEDKHNINEQIRIQQMQREQPHQQQQHSQAQRQTKKKQNIQQQQSGQQSMAPLQQHNQQQTPRCILPHAYALFDFVTAETTDLNFKKGDLILLKKRIDNNWFFGQTNGREGTFPINYVQVIVPLPTPQCIALYDFKMGPNEEEGCLTFKKGTVINVIRRIDPNWAEGRIAQAIGIFPIAFVELNSLAKQILENGAVKQNGQSILMANTMHNMIQQLKPAPTNNAGSARLLQPIRNLPPIPNTQQICEIKAINSTATTTSIDATSQTSIQNTCASSSKSCSPNILLSSAALHKTKTGSSSVRYRDKGAKEKRHSLNALLLSATNVNGQATSLSLLQANRHSAEILSLPYDADIVRSNLTNCTINFKEDNEPNTQQSQQEKQMSIDVQQQISNSSGKRVNVLKTNVQQNVPTTLPWGYLALYPYKPRKNDELELKKGCVYIVTERCMDGWFKGRNWQDISGVFPGNYVTPLRARDQQQLIHQWKYLPQAQTNASTHVEQTKEHSIQDINVSLSNLLTQQSPPDLPPRHITDDNITMTTTSCSVWTKPLGQTVEAFFKRNSTNAQQPQCIEVKHKQEPNGLNTSASSSNNGAVSLMKRLTNIKSHSKSPCVQLQNKNSVSEPSTNTENKKNNSVQMQEIQPIHVRSGSCPSQLLQSLPDEPITTLQRSVNVEQRQSQQCTSSKTIAATHTINFGAQHINNCKEQRPQLCIRQSLDASMFRGMHNNSNSPKSTSQTKVYTQMQHLTTGSQLHHHRKSQSLDASRNGINTVINNGVNVAINNSITAMSLPSNVTEADIKASATTKSTQCIRESRFRCIVPYPPNSDIELELHIGDIIYVQRKQKNGWYKGTHARTNKTGLFPASFVEPDV